MRANKRTVFEALNACWCLPRDGSHKHTTRADSVLYLKEDQRGR
jgi:hypothetical protein